MRQVRPYNFEFNVFKWLLIGSVIFWCYRIATHLLFDNQLVDLTIDFVTLLITIGIIFALNHYKNFNHLIIVYCLILIAGYIYFWYRLGGLNGPISYSYFALIAFFVVILPVNIREIAAILFCGFTILLALKIPDSLFDITTISQNSKLLLPFDYIINAIIVAVILVLVKKNFDMERSLLERNSIHVRELNRQQQEKTNKLLDQQQKIKSIKENLELLVKERTAEFESKNKQLEEYAFHNAHLVRKPLSNIQGLINILEIEEVALDQENLTELKKNVKELDIITRKINFILQ